MKLPILFALILFTVTITGSNSQDPSPDSAKSDDEIFNDYMQKYNIRLRRKVDFEKLKQNVLKHDRAIKEQNRRFKEGNETFEAALYPFAHLSDEEFAENYLGALPDDPNHPIYVNETENRRGRLMTPPETYFRWPESIAGRVKSQGSCGSCYAFAAIGVIKSRRVLKYGGTAEDYDLSEQDAMECTRGCSGGWEYLIYRDYSQKYGGCAAYNYQKLHAYSGVSYTCQAAWRPRVPGTKVENYVYLQSNEKTIREYLYNYGPLYTRYDVYENFYSYRDGIYTYASGRRLGGHAG